MEVSRVLEGDGQWQGLLVGLTLFRAPMRFDMVCLLAFAMGLGNAARELILVRANDLFPVCM